MTTASGLPALVDALVLVANTAFGATSPVEVFDGPGYSQDDTGQQFWVGVNDPTQSRETSAESDQTWGPMGAHKRDEEATVHCMALAWSGDDDLKTVRDQAFAQMQAITNAVVTDPSLSGAVLYARSPGSSVTLVQGPNSNGMEARVGFDVTARIRLT